MYQSRRHAQNQDMRGKTLIVWLGVASALFAASLHAEAATAFDRSLAELSNADREAMERARNEVLAKMTPGAVATWKDDRTGHSGEARLLRTYEQNGMACGEVEHIIRIREANMFVVPLCRTSDGMWRFAFR